jgi:hypothetical protein
MAAAQHASRALAVEGRSAMNQNRLSKGPDGRSAMILIIVKKGVVVWYGAVVVRFPLWEFSCLGACRVSDGQAELAVCRVQIRSPRPTNLAKVPAQHMAGWPVGSGKICAIANPDGRVAPMAAKGQLKAKERSCSRLDRPKAELGRRPVGPARAEERRWRSLDPSHRLAVGSASPPAQINKSSGDSVTYFFCYLIRNH